MAKKRSKSGKFRKVLPNDVPNFTGSLDAAVPAEDIIYVDHILETGRWYTISQTHDGAMFAALGNTEPTSRRAAGLLTLAHLTELAEGKLAHVSSEQVALARAELVSVLQEAVNALAGFNGEFPASRTRDLVEFQLQTAKAAVEITEDKGIIGRYVGPIACFLAGGFANGLLGKLGERALELLDKILAN